MRRATTIVCLALLGLATGALVVWGSGRFNPSADELSRLSTDQIRRFEPAYGGGDNPGPPSASQAPTDAVFFLEPVAPEDRAEVERLLREGRQPNLRQRPDGLLELNDTEDAR